MKILIVGDEPLILVGLAMQVADWGYDVVEASSADEAVAVLERQSDIGLVVTDVDMPGKMNGLHLAKFVRERWPPVGLIIISGKLPVERSQLPSRSRFFEKPVREQSLRKAIEELVE
jgi:YesN/AraC family two-component response regulator